MPIKPDQNETESLKQEFINGASFKSTPSITSQRPWEGVDDTEKTKAVNLRLTKSDLLKLQYISKNTPFSIQAFVYGAVKAAIDTKLKELN